jgi:hypothetical protein
MSEHVDVTGPAERLVSVIRYYVEQQEAAPRSQQASSVSMGELATRALDPLGDIREAVRDPMRFACRSEAREIGWYLYAMGGTHLMNRALALATQNDERVPWIVDAWWSFIGRGDDLWTP